MASIVSCTSKLKQNLDFQVNSKTQVRFDSLVSLFQLCRNNRISVEEFTRVNPRRQIDVIKDQFRQKGILTTKLDDKINLVFHEMKSFTKIPSAEAFVSEKSETQVKKSKNKEIFALKSHLSFRVNNSASLRFQALISLFQLCERGNFSVDAFRQINHRKQIEIIKTKSNREAPIPELKQINIWCERMDRFVAPMSEDPVVQSIGWIFFLGILALLSSYERSQR